MSLKQYVDLEKHTFIMLVKCVWVSNRKHSNPIGHSAVDGESNCKASESVHGLDYAECVPLGCLGPQVFLIPVAQWRPFSTFFEKRSPFKVNQPATRMPFLCPGHWASELCCHLVAQLQLLERWALLGPEGVCGQL